MSDESQSEEPAPGLGASLRRLRFQRRMSMAAVSAATGIAKSTLSRVENDQLSLTYSKLQQLCKGLQIDIGELFCSEISPELRQPAARRAFSKPAEGRTVMIGTQAYSYLCAGMAGKKMTPMISVIHSRTLAETHGLSKREGEEFAFVLEGQLALHTEFYEPLILDAGGSVYFDSTMGHAYLSAGTVPLKLLRVTTKPLTELPADPMTDQGAREKSRSG
jgi:transcriptional regulator with XRE-family HTH domain